MLLISAHFLDPFQKLRSFRKWDKGMDINPEEETSSTQYQEALLRYVENESRAKYWCVPVNKAESVPRNNLVPSVTASGSGQSSFDPSDLSGNNGEYVRPPKVGEMTPGRSDRAASLLTSARLYLNSPPGAPKNWWQIDPNLNDYHSDPMLISSTLRLPDITYWWRQHEELHTEYADPSNLARDIFFIIPHGVGVGASSSLGHDVIGWRQSKTTSGTLRKKFIVRQFTRANHRILAGDVPA